MGNRDGLHIIRQNILQQFTKRSIVIIPFNLCKFLPFRTVFQGGVLNQKCEITDMTVRIGTNQIQNLKIRYTFNQRNRSFQLCIRNSHQFGINRKLTIGYAACVFHKRTLIQLVTNLKTRILGNCNHILNSKNLCNFRHGRVSLIYSTVRMNSAVFVN